MWELLARQSMQQKCSKPKDVVPAGSWDGSKQDSSRSGSAGRSEMVEAGEEKGRDEVVNLVRGWREWKKAD